MIRWSWHWVVWGAAVGLFSGWLTDDWPQRLKWMVIVMLVSLATVLIWQGLSLPTHDRGGDGRDVW